MPDPRALRPKQPGHHKLEAQICMPYTQNYDPCHNLLLSVLLASLPVVTLFVMLVPLRLLAPWAAAGGAFMALVIAVLAYGMPAHMAGLSFLNGALFGLLPICWVISCAMLLYNITVETGRFQGIKRSVAGLSADHRLQAVLIAFCFGAFLEGAAGGGTPVAICAAMLVGLGFDPFRAACLCLIANTSPVAYGGFGTPLLTLESVTDIPVQTLSRMAGNQLPFLSFLIPLWLVRCMCGWKDTFEVWPAILVSGGSFALSQFIFAHSAAFPLTDIAGGLISLLATGILLIWWKPGSLWRFQGGHSSVAGESLSPIGASSRVTARDALRSWTPFIVLCVLMTFVGVYKQELDSIRIGSIKTLYELHMPNLDRSVRRIPPVVERESLEAATWRFNWVTTPGTSVFVTVLIALAYLRPKREQVRRAFSRTIQQMAIPVPTIICMLGLGSVTRLSGLDASLGMAFKNTGAAYPFFSAILGWLGVFLTGTDAASNALFGSLQKITAIQLNLSPVLITVANSTGGVMGKMIDAQSICVATAATERIGTEADIFKFVVWHSIALASIVGLLIFGQAHALRWMVPG